MKKYLYLLLLNYLVTNQLYAQTDTASYPYWINMMQDESVNFFQTQYAFNTYWQGRTIEKGSGWKAFKRWEYSTALRTNSSGKITPESNYYYELKRWDSLYAIPNNLGMGIGAPCYTNGLWKEIGPMKYPANNTGQPTGMGRINALAFHPNDSTVIYAGAPAGGLWISKDYGKNWSTTTDTLATLGISAIAIDTHAPDTIYLGTGDRDASDAAGLGILWSKDGGKSWALRNSGMGNQTVGRLIIHPSNSAILIAATSNGIYRTNNYGSNWTQRISGNFKDVVFSPSNPNIVYATKNGFFYKSTDNGVNWTQITSGLPSSGVSRGVIAVTPADTNYVYFVETNGSVYQGTYRSTDKGATFSTRSTTPNIMDYSNNGSGSGGQAWYDLDVAADPNNKDVIYVCGVNIFKSTDGGSTWTINAHWVGSGAPSVHADNHVLELHPKSNHLFTGNDGGVYFTPNGGTAWNNISSNLAVSQIYKLGQSATKKKVLVNGYQDNGTARYDGSFTTVRGGDGMDCLVDFTDESISYGELYYGEIFRVKNNNTQGNVAGNGVNGMTEAGAWVTPFILKSNDANTMFVGHKNIWRSTNVKAASVSSVSWTKITNNLGGSNSVNINFLESNSSQPNMLYMARGDNKLFRTSDAHSASPTFTDLSSTLPNNATINSIETHGKDSNIVYIAQSNKIYKSTNRGSTWTNISANLPNVPFLTIVLDTNSSTEELYVGGWGGVYYKDNTGTNWIKYSDGLPRTARVQDLEIYYSPNGKAESHLVAATYGRGNWATPLKSKNEKPIAKFEITDTTVCKSATIQISNESLNLPTYYLWDITPKSYTYTNATDSTSENPSVKLNDATKYTFTLIVENCMGYDTLTKTFKVESFELTRKAPCVASNVYTNWAMGIADFTLNGKTHSSGYTNSEGPYLDLTCTTIFKLKADTSYEVNITTNPSNSEYVRGWIDFNDNGDFTDVGENVIKTPQAKTHIDTIVIPANVVLNKPLRMRIMSDFNIFTNRCGSINYGQTQDYAIYIDLPVIKAKSFKDSVCAYAPVQIIDSSAKNFGTYAWDFGKHATPKTATGKGPHSVSYDTTGYQKIKLTVNGAHSKTFDSLVFVKPAPKMGWVTIPNTSGICEFSKDSLTSKDSNLVATSYFWLKNGLSISNNASTFKWPSLALSDSGLYAVVGHIKGCSDTANAQKISVKPTPKAGFSINDSTQCTKGNSFNFTSTASIKQGTFNQMYSFGDGNSSKLANPSHSYSSANSFKVKQKVTTAFGCNDSTTKSIETFVQPKAQLTLNQDSFCFKSQNFDLTATSSIGKGSIIQNYWSTTGITLDSGTNFKPKYATSSSFPVKLIALSNNNCRDTLSVILDVFPNPVSRFSINDSIQCLLGNQFSYTQNSSVSSGTVTKFTWDLGDLTTSSSSLPVNKSYSAVNKYTIRLVSETNKGCKDTIQKTVEIFPQPKALLKKYTMQLCFNSQPFALNDSSNISSGFISKYHYSWGDLSVATTQNATHSYNNEGSFNGFFKVESDKGCLDSLLFTHTVNPNPKADFDFDLVCVNDTTEFTNTSTIILGTINSQKWYLETGDVRTTLHSKKRFNQAGDKLVSLVATSDRVCKDSVTKTVKVYPKPVAAFSYVIEPIGGNTTHVSLTDKSTGSITWLWSDGNGQTDNTMNTIFTYSDSSTVNLTLKVSNTDGCEDSALQRIKINPKAVLYFPTAFTPNGDFNNDILKVEGIDFVKSYSLIIFNRWGEIVFQTTNPKQHWDGYYLEKPLAVGLYPYKVDIIDLAGNKSSERGVIQLLR